MVILIFIKLYLDIAESEFHGKFHKKGLYNKFENMVSFQIRL